MVWKARKQLDESIRFGSVMKKAMFIIFLLKTEFNKCVKRKGGKDAPRRLIRNLFISFSTAYNPLNEIRA